MGLACAVFTVVMYVVMVVFAKRASSSFGVAGVALQMFAACVVSAAVCAMGQMAGQLSLAPPSAGDIPAIVVLGLVNGGLCCFWYFDSIAKLPAATVAVCDYLEPTSSLVFSAVFMGERLGAVQMIGAACILAGAIGSEL